MTPAQKAALEALRGSPLSPEQASAVDNCLFLGDHEGVARIISQGRTKIVKHEIGDGALCTALGGPDGPLLMLNLELIAVQPVSLESPLEQRTAVANARQALRSLGRVGFDVGNEYVRSSLQSMVGTLMTQAMADKLKALAVRPDPIEHTAVSAALKGIQ
jgi:hypothetical protein